MKCLLCENFSLMHICPSCQELFLTPSLYKRKLSNGVEVISFYKYSEIKKLLFTKHTDLGYYIYNILATKSFTKFAQEFNSGFPTVSIGIDDNVKSGYAHTAILNRHLKSKNITPLYNKLIAKNDISYSGKSKEFRIMNPRNFELKIFNEKNVILVDDIITTGTTLTEASNLLKRQKKELLFCLTLTDVSQK
ncbi:MAG: phosphoribosyltransferase family protein [Sulfurimonas sp.]